MFRVASSKLPSDIDCCCPISFNANAGVTRGGDPASFVQHMNFVSNRNDVIFGAGRLFNSLDSRIRIMLFDATVETVREMIWDCSALR